MDALRLPRRLGADDQRDRLLGSPAKGRACIRPRHAGRRTPGELRRDISASGQPRECRRQQPSAQRHGFLGPDGCRRPVRVNTGRSRDARCCRWKACRDADDGHNREQRCRSADGRACLSGLAERVEDIRRAKVGYKFSRLSPGIQIGSLPARPPAVKMAASLSQRARCGASHRLLGRRSPPAAGF